MIDYPLPSGPLGSEKEPRMTLKEAARAAVAAYAKDDDAGLIRALDRLDELTSDDRPAPVDLVEMCESILLSPYKCPRWLTGPVEPCAAFKGHRGPCLRARDIVREIPRHGA